MMHSPALHVTESTFGIALQSRPPSAVRSPNGESFATHPPQLSRSFRTSTHSYAFRKPRPDEEPKIGQLFWPRAHVLRFTVRRCATLVGLPPPAVEDEHERGE